jgi:predicted RNase H-like HicB family nuclease
MQANQYVIPPKDKYGMNFKIEYDQEADGRWLAELPQIPGVMAYGNSKEEAMAKTEALALRALARV